VLKYVHVLICISVCTWSFGCCWEMFKSQQWYVLCMERLWTSQGSGQNRHRTILV